MARSLGIAGLLFLALGGVGEQTVASENVFAEPTRVWPVHVEVAADEYEAMQPHQQERGWFGFGRREKAEERKVDPGRVLHRNNFGVDLPWAKGTVTLNGERFENVGLRYKGNGTIGDSMHTVKKSLKFDLDRHGGEQRFLGRKTINVHSGAADPSKCREPLGYSVYRAAGVPAPRTTLVEVQLSVPGKFDRELLGVYTLVEAVDKPFLEERFGDGDGLLFKPEHLREIDYLGDDWAQYEELYEPERKATAEEAARTIAFAKLVHEADDAEFAEKIGSFLDIEAYLRFLAATAYVANPDSFFVLGHNYYLYLHPKTGQFHFMPWDLDRAFGNFPGVLGSNSEQMNMRITHPYAGTHRLTERLLAMPQVAERYQTLFKELAGTAFEKTRVQGELAAIEAAMKDVRTREQAASEARNEEKGRTFGAPARLDDFLERRGASIEAQLAGTSEGHLPTRGFPFGPPPRERNREGRSQPR